MAAIAAAAMTVSCVGNRGTIVRSFATPEDFDGCTRDTTLCALGSGGLQLAGEEFIISGSGNKLAPGRLPGVTNPTRFTETVLGKRTFQLDDPAAERVEFYIFRGTAGQATLNGVPLRFSQFVHHGSWIKAEADGSALRRGQNEIVFGAGTACCVERAAPARTPPLQSSTSRDGGKTWLRQIEGEFFVNIRLIRHPSRGVTTSPVIDLASPDDRDVIRPLIDVRGIAIETIADCPTGTAVRLEARSGSMPLPVSGWSEWRKASSVPPGRYVQWRATLTTTDPLATPALTRVDVRADLTPTAQADGRGLAVNRFINAHPARSSLPFTYQGPSPRLRELREKYRLDEVVAAGKTDWEKLVLLRNWVRMQWPQNDNGPYERHWDALEILSAPDDHHGMCVQYGVAFTQCAAALGYVSRHLIVQNHFIADVWSDDYGKWVAMDVETAVKPTHDTAHYIDARTGVPLDMLELHRAFHAALSAGKSQIDGVLQYYYADTPQVSQVLQPRPFPMTNRTPTRFLFVPRNDFLDNPEPWEEFHGCDNYRSNDYYWWRSEFAAGAEPQYPHTTDRVADLFWKVNQTHLALTATGEGHVLSVCADTLTPNVTGIEVRRDDGGWQMESTAGRNPPDLAVQFNWTLHPGVNRLWARSVNAFGRRGAASYVEVVR